MEGPVPAMGGAHTSVARQVVPHPPQFWKSEVMSTQAPPQLMRGGRQTHALSMQTCESMHTVPHAPQFSGSPAPVLLVHTAGGPAQVRLPAHVHVPDTHASPVSQWLPHLPQLATETLGSKQMPPHIDSPATEHAHAPATQVWPVGHAGEQGAPELLVVELLVELLDEVPVELLVVELLDEVPVAPPPPAPVVVKGVVHPNAPASMDTTRTMRALIRETSSELSEGTLQRHRMPAPRRRAGIPR